MSFAIFQKKVNHGINLKDSYAIVLVFMHLREHLDRQIFNTIDATKMVPIRYRYLFNAIF